MFLYLLSPILLTPVHALRTKITGVTLPTPCLIVPRKKTLSQQHDDLNHGKKMLAIGD